MAEKRAARGAMGIADRRPPATCRGCASRWSGTRRAHCSACHLTFSSASAFDRHRAPDGEHGRCLDPRTLTGANGLVRRNGVWSWPPMPDNIRFGGDTTPQRPFAVIHGADQSHVLIEAGTTNYTCETFGELFADLAYQLRNGEYSAMMHRLNACANAYGHVPVAEEDDDDAV